MTTTKFRDLRDLRPGDIITLRHGDAGCVLSLAKEDACNELTIRADGVPGRFWRRNGEKWSCECRGRKCEDIIFVTRRSRVIWRKDEPAAKPVKKAKPKRSGSGWPVWKWDGSMYMYPTRVEARRSTQGGCMIPGRRRVRWEEE